MTAGADGMTLDDMTEARITRIIALLKNHSYQPNPARREYIAKQNNPAKKRPRGIPSTDDKLVQEVVRMMLNAIYKPTFSNNSHGFRPHRSCHTALQADALDLNLTCWRDALVSRNEKKEKEAAISATRDKYSGFFSIITTQKMGQWVQCVDGLL